MTGTTRDSDRGGPVAAIVGGLFLAAAALVGLVGLALAVVSVEGLITDRRTGVVSLAYFVSFLLFLVAPGMAIRGALTIRRAEPAERGELMGTMTVLVLLVGSSAIALGVIVLAMISPTI